MHCASKPLTVADLPPELLSRVFPSVLAAVEDREDLYARQRYRLLVLAPVCRRFYKVASKVDADLLVSDGRRGIEDLPEDRLALVTRLHLCGAPKPQYTAPPDSNGDDQETTTTSLSRRLRHLIGVRELRIGSQRRRQGRSGSSLATDPRLAEITEWLPSLPNVTHLQLLVGDKSAVRRQHEHHPCHLFERVQPFLQRCAGLKVLESDLVIAPMSSAPQPPPAPFALDELRVSQISSRVLDYLLGGCRPASVRLGIMDGGPPASATLAAQLAITEFSCSEIQLGGQWSDPGYPLPHVTRLVTKFYHLVDADSAALRIATHLPALAHLQVRRGLYPSTSPRDNAPRNFPDLVAEGLIRLVPLLRTPLRTLSVEAESAWTEERRLHLEHACRERHTELSWLPDSRKPRVKVDAKVKAGP